MVIDAKVSTKAIDNTNLFGGNLRTSEKESDWIVHSTDKMLLGIPNEVHGDKKFVFKGAFLCSIKQFNAYSSNSSYSISFRLTGS